MTEASFKIVILLNGKGNVYFNRRNFSVLAFLASFPIFAKVNLAKNSQIDRSLKLIRAKIFEKLIG